MCVQRKEKGRVVVMVMVVGADKKRQASQKMGSHSLRLIKCISAVAAYARICLNSVCTVCRYSRCMCVFSGAVLNAARPAGHRLPAWMRRFAGEQQPG